jgi:hypothetical protein
MILLCVPLAYLGRLWHLESHSVPCGLDISRVTYYNAPPSDSFFPEPQVDEVSMNGGRSLVRIEYVVPNQSGDDVNVIVRNADIGGMWIQESKRTREHEFNRMSSHSTVYRLNEDFTFERSVDGGNQWTKPALRVGGESLASFSQRLTPRADVTLTMDLAAIHPSDPNTIFGCFHSSRKRTNERAQAGAAIRNPGGIYVSHDGGENWVLFSDKLRGFSPDESCVLGIAPSDPDIMVGHGISEVAITRDGGKNWTAVGQHAELEAPAPLKGYVESLAEIKKKGLKPTAEWPFGWTYLRIVQIAFQPNDVNTFYLVTNKGIYKTQDGAKSWRLLDTGVWSLFGLHSLYIDPTNSRRIFVGTNTKVLVSDDAGCHFSTFFDYDQFVHRH